MAGNKYLYHNAGRLTEMAAVQTSAGAGDAGKIPALDDSGRLDSTLMPPDIGKDVATFVASEDLAAGDIVNIFDASGTPKARKADATATGKEADGYVLDAVTATQSVKVYFEGTNTALTGLTIGARHYLSATTPGAVTTTPPTGAGDVVQYVGRAISATTLSFEPSDGIVLA